MPSFYKLLNFGGDTGSRTRVSAMRMPRTATVLYPHNICLIPCHLSIVFGQGICPHQESNLDLSLRTGPF